MGGPKGAAGDASALLGEVEREEHRQLAEQLSKQLQAQRAEIEAAEAALRRATSATEQRRLDEQDINTYLESQLHDRREQGDKLAAELNAEESAAIHASQALRSQIDAEEHDSEMRRLANRKRMGENEEALAFMGAYDSLSRQNGETNTELSALRVHVAAAAAELALKTKWSRALGLAVEKADESGTGALPTLLIALLGTFGEEAMVQEQALMMLAALLVDDDVHNAALIHRLGGVAAIVKTLRAHGGSAAIALHACLVLWLLALSSRRVSDEVVAQDGIALLVGAINSHTDNSRLVYNACGALCHLVVTRPQMLTVASQIAASPVKGFGAQTALARRAKPSHAVGAADSPELRRQIELLRGPNSSQATSGARIASGGGPARQPHAQSALSRRKNAQRTALRAAGAWHHSLLTAAVAKLTRNERADLPIAPARVDPATLVVELAARDLDLKAVLGALLRAVRAHMSKAKVLESSLCAIWNLQLGSSALARELLAADGALDALVDALRRHGAVAGVVLYALAILLALAEADEAAEALEAQGVGRLVQDVARSHPYNEPLQEGAVYLLDALDRTRARAQRADAQQLPAGWSVATRAQWEALSVKLRRAFAELAPDKTVLYRTLDTLHLAFPRLLSIFRHYATGTFVSRDVAIGATLQQNVREWHLLSAREWLVLCKHCKLATSSFGRAELTRAFMQLAVDPKDGLGEPTLAFDEFVQVLVLVAFERVNPFAADWLLGHSADVPLVPLDEALAHFLSNHLLALSDAPDAAVAFRLITNEQVESVVAQHRPLLVKIFKRSSSRAGRVGLVDFLTLLRAAGLLPGFVSAKDALVAFADALHDGPAETRASGAHESEADGADQVEFIEALCRAAVGRLAVGLYDSPRPLAEAAVAQVGELLGEIAKAYARGALPLDGPGGC